MALLTNAFHVDQATQYREEIVESPTYFFVGDYTTHANDVVQTVNNSIQDAYYDVWNKMIMGKRLNENAMNLGIANILYEANTIYTQYDDTIDLSNTNYYIIVPQGSYSHVYKCLYNNKNSPSLYAPDFAVVQGANTVLYQTADGYCWKYMCSVSTDAVYTFGTASYFPLIANTSVAAAAVPGSINVIKINDEGKLYNNYTSGVFNTSQIKIDGSSTLYGVANTTLKLVNDYYNGCIIYLPLTGQYRTITTYVSNTSGNFIVLDNGFDTVPVNGTQYEINPACRVYDDGTSSNACVARALVNAYSSNSISTIEVIYPGSDYRSMVTANVISAPVVGVTSFANVRPILPPPGGHGANSALELNASNLLFTITLEGSEGGTILTSNMFQQLGLLKSPLFANVGLTLSTSTGNFTIGELAYMVDPSLVVSNVTTSTGVTVITADSGDFENQFSVGDQIILSDTVSYQLANVTYISNSSQLSISDYPVFTTSTATIHYPNITGSAIIDAIATSLAITVTNTTGEGISTGALMIGGESGTMAMVSSVQRNGVSKFFNTFNQLTKFTVTAVQGVFTEGETIIQGTSSALLHSIISNSTMYVNNLTAPFAIGGFSVIGQSSGATATITAIYPPELIPESGLIEYLDNVSPVTRTPDETEQFNIVLQF